MEACPNVSKPPFNLPVKSLGQLLYIVPDCVTAEEASLLMIDGKIVTTTNVSKIFLFGLNIFLLLKT